MRENLKHQTLPIVSFSSLDHTQHDRTVPPRASLEGLVALRFPQDPHRLVATLEQSRVRRGHCRASVAQRRACIPLDPLRDAPTSGAVVLTQKQTHICPLRGMRGIGKGHGAVPQTQSSAGHVGVGKGGVEGHCSPLSGGEAHGHAATVTVAGLLRTAWVGEGVGECQRRHAPRHTHDAERERERERRERYAHTHE